MSKATSPAPLELDDGPAHGCDLFLVDGNNLAYRAYFALPEELATSDGQPTNALLGFANMLFKLLVDYKPRAVAVAWDTRPQERLAASAAYKADRKPMPDLLREQFPHFAPLVEAFGYRNLRFAGWEADDVIATLATRADLAGLKTCVVSTDRDALQLVSERVCLMMTPRGVSDVQVYTPERVLARYGVRPLQIPDFIGLKGDSSDNIAGVPGIGDKTAAQLLARYGTLDEVLARASEQPPARARALVEHAEQARASRALATTRRDLPLDCDPAALVQQLPDRSRMREIFRRFELKALLKRTSVLDAALPSAEGGSGVAPAVWRAAGPDDLAGLSGAALAVAGGRYALARDGGVVVGWWSEEVARALEGAALIAHDAKSLPISVRVLDDTLLAAYLIEPSRPSYLVGELAQEQGVEVEASPPTDAATAELVTGAESARRLAPRLRARLRERGEEALYDELELPLIAVLRGMEARGVRVDAARLAAVTREVSARVAQLEARAHELGGGAFSLASPKQLGQVLFERLGLPAGRKTKTGFSTDARVLRELSAAHPIVPVIEEWRELATLLHGYLESLPAFIRADGRVHTSFRQTSAATGRLATRDPNLQAIPVRSELGRSIRAAFVAEPGWALISADYSQVELRLLAQLSGEQVLLDAFRRGVDIHTATAAELAGKRPEEIDEQERAAAKRVNFGILYGISAFGLSEDLELSREEAQATIDRYLERLPAVRAFIAETIARARVDGYVSTIRGRRRPIPELRAENRQTRALGERLAVNTRVQGSAADLIKLAMLRVVDRLRAERSRGELLLQIHDELLLEAPLADVEVTRALVCEEMIAAYPMSPPLVVDSSAGPDWASVAR